MNLIHLACDLAEDVRNNAQDVVGIYLIYVSFLDQAMVVIDVSANALLYSLELG